MTISLPYVHSGKVRDIYAVGDDRLLMVTSDRMSAFDVVMAEPIPHKGRVLTAMSAFWFDVLGDVVGNHLISMDPADLPEGASDGTDDLAGRIMLCHKAEMLPIECIVRGLHHRVGLEGVPEGGHDARPAAAGRPAGERAAPRAGVHALDEGRRRPRREHLLRGGGRRSSGEDVAAKARDVSLELYSPRRRAGPRAGDHHRRHEVRARVRRRRAGRSATRCSRPTRAASGPSDQWKPGTTPPSFDKQPLRDYLETLDWDKTPPPPSLPDEVVAATRDRYIEGYERITGKTFADWPGVS